MTEEDKKDIARMVANLLKDQQCPHGIDADTAAALKDFAGAWSASKKTLIKTIVTWLTLALIGATAWSITEKIKHLEP